jgi:hypothetical protein
MCVSQSAHADVAYISCESGPHTIANSSGIMEEKPKKYDAMNENYVIRNLNDSMGGIGPNEKHFSAINFKIEISDNKINKWYYYDNVRYVKIDSNDFFMDDNKYHFNLYFTFFDKTDVLNYIMLMESVHIDRQSGEISYSNFYNIFNGVSKYHNDSVGNVVIDKRDNYAFYTANSKGSCHKSDNLEITKF